MKIAEIFLLHKGDNSRLKNNSLLLINSFSINKPIKPYFLHIICFYCHKRCVKLSIRYSMMIYLYKIIVMKRLVQVA